MAAVYTPLIPATPAFDAADTPFSPRYGDVYHAAQGAEAQARHVFLGGNGLPARWRGRERFTVCETGFGLGTNFLVLWQAWRDDPQRSRRLHVVSVEAHPYARDDLAAMLLPRLDGPLRDLARQLLAQWPPLVPGLHRMDFEGGALTLTLAFGLAQTVVPRLAARVDAFFLDGFAPDRNADMWSAPLMKALARLAAPDASAATWCSAGHVRRALASAGFAVTRESGYGGKRHMTVARYAPAFVPRRRAADGTPDVAPASAGRVLVVGAGVAGAGVARAMASRGWDVRVFDPLAGPARAGEPQHWAAALTPLIARDDNGRARLSRAGALRAAARWLPWLDGRTVARLGTLQLARSDAREAALHQALAELALPAEWVEAVDGGRASALAGVPLARGGAFFPGGLRVRPRLLCAALLDHPRIGVVPARVGRLAGTAEGSWQARDADGRLLDEAPHVVLANAHAAPSLLAASGWDAPGDGGARADGGDAFFSQQAIAGQITLLPTAAWGGRLPARIVAGDGYVLPPVDGCGVLGSTYVHGAATAEATDAGHALNLARGAGLVPGLAAGGDAAGLAGWAGWRAVLPGGRLPVIGPLPGAPGLWLATGYASRGLSWSALAGDLIGAMLEGEPLMLERDILELVRWR